MIYAIGCASIVIFGLAAIVANICNAAVVDCDSKPIDWFLKTISFLQAIVIMGLLVYFLCSVM